MMQRSGERSIASGSLYNRSVLQQGEREVTRAAREGGTSQHRIQDNACIYKGDFGLLDICQCQVNGIWEFAGTVTIRGFDTFSICKSSGSKYRISYGSTLKLSGRRRSHGVYK